jgi:catechol 2,3-dioxygenase-like lactoylglutathione lyase family enzyme
MLADKKLKAFVSTTDPARAKKFYKNILGLSLKSEDDFALEFNANETSLRISIVQDLKPQPFTVLGWDVGDIKAVISSLISKGVSFERYDFLRQDETGVWASPSGAKVAWFKDPDGNLLSLTELK